MFQDFLRAHSVYCGGEKLLKVYWLTFVKEKERKMKMVLRFLRDERGTETVEWAIMVGLIAVAAIATVILIGQHVTTTFQNLETQMPQ